MLAKIVNYKSGDLVSIRLPTFNILSAIVPQNIGARNGRLRYGNRRVRIKRAFMSLEPTVWHAFLEAEPGSLIEREATQELSLLLMEVESTRMQALNDGHHADLVAALAELFTEQSIQVYGTQDVRETVATMQHDLQLCAGLPKLNGEHAAAYNRLLEGYARLGVAQIEAVGSHSIASGLTPNDRRFAAVTTRYFSDVLEHFKPSQLYSSRNIKQRIQSVLQVYARQDRRWKRWSVGYKPDGSMSVLVEKRQILIGRKRAVVSGEEAGAAVVHELVHAMRGVHYASILNGALKSQLFDYAVFEEGLGCYIEFLIRGQVPEKLSNRQIAASLALGQLGDAHKWDRSEIYSLLADRTRLMMLLNGTFTERRFRLKKKELRMLVIDRFFRGGSGVRPALAVFTKDVMYAQGFSAVKRFIRSQLARGVRPEELLQYLLSARFDPTNEQHVELLKSVGIHAPKSR